MGKSHKRKQPTMDGTFHGSVGPNPNWLGGRRILYLTVPFADKDAVKALGAKWDTDKRMWWIFADVDRMPFLQWLRDDHKPADLQERRDWVIANEADRQERLNAERRARWQEVYRGQPWPAERNPTR